MKLTFALLAFLLMGCTGPASSAKTSSAPEAAAEAPASGALATLTLANDARRDLASRVASFGVVFQKGAVRPGDPVDATIDGRAFPTQVDAKALNPDGSVRHAIVSVELPELRGGQQLKATLVKGAAAKPPQTGRYVPAPPLVVKLGLTDASGRSRTVAFDVQKIATTTSLQKPDTWLSGPLAQEQRYVVDVDSRLQILFDVFRPRSGPSRVDVIFRNDWNDAKLDDAMAYDVEIAMGDKTVFARRNLKHNAFTSWHRLIWSDGAEPIRASPSLAELVSAGATPRYDLRFNTNAARGQLAEAMSSVASDPTGSGTLTRYMPTSGGRMEIGPLPMWAVLDLMNSDALTRRALITNADAAGAVPWHVRERPTGQPLTLDKYPNLWLDQRSADITPLAEPFEADRYGWQLDVAHEPSLTYVPYLVTGLRYYKDELEQHAAYVLFSVDPGYRHGAEGLFIGDGQGLLQVRGLAWGLRTLATAAYILPTHGSLQPYFDAKLRGNLAQFVKLLVTNRILRSAGEVEGWAPGAARPEDATSPWQQGFLAVTLGWINDMGYADAGRTLGWMSNFLSGLFTSKAQGFDPGYGVISTVTVMKPDGQQPLSSWRAVASATDVSGLDRSQLADLWTFYGLILRAALGYAYALDASPRTLAAYDYVTKHDGVQSTSGDPTFAIVPR